MVKAYHTSPNKKIKIQTLKKRFKTLNPEVGVDMVDWESEVGKRESYGEALQDLRHAYPEYKWLKQKLDPYAKVVTTEIRRQADEYGYTVVKKRDMTVLRRGALHLGHHNPKVRDRIKGKTVFVIEHNRKWVPTKKKPTSKRKIAKKRKKVS